MIKLSNMICKKYSTAILESLSCTEPYVRHNIYVRSYKYCKKLCRSNISITITLHIVYGRDYSKQMTDGCTLCYCLATTTIIDSEYFVFEYFRCIKQKNTSRFYRLYPKMTFRSLSNFEEGQQTHYSVFTVQL